MMIPGSNLALRSEEEREAPSPVINGCKTAALWHLLIALAFLSLAVTLPWYVIERDAAIRPLFILNGLPEPEDDTRFYSGIFGGLALVCALLMLHSWYGLHTFVRERRVSLLHPALRRLRSAWRTIALIQLAAVIYFGWWVYTVILAPEAGGP